jgi:argininosuccinate lyase
MYKILCDVEIKIHEQLENNLDGNGNYPDRMVRILEEIQRSKEFIKTGISETRNFETALLKAAERGQFRAIDAIIQDIRELKSAIGNGQPSMKPSDEDDFEKKTSRLSPDILLILKEALRAKITTLNTDE